MPAIVKRLDIIGSPPRIYVRLKLMSILSTTTWVSITKSLLLASFLVLLKVIQLKKLGAVLVTELTNGAL